MTIAPVLLRTVEDTDSHYRVYRIRAGGFVITIGLAAVALVLIWAGVGLPVIAVLVAALATALAGKSSVLANIPQAFVGLLVSVVAASMMAPLVGGLRSEGAAHSVFSALALGTVVLAYARRRALRHVFLASMAEAVACVPAVLFAVVGVGLSFASPGTATRWFFQGIDNVNHVAVVGDLQVAGALKYDANPYPRGWHSLIALVNTASSGPYRPEYRSLIGAVTTLATSTWLLYGLLIAAAALATVRLCGQRCRSGPAALAGAMAAATLFLPQFMTYILEYGAQTKLLFAVVLMTAALELLQRGSDRSHSLLGCCVVATAHSWQVGLPVVGLAYALAFIRDWRARPQRMERWRLTAAFAAVAVPAAVLCLPPVLSMFAKTTPTHTIASAAEQGVDVGNISWFFLGLALVACIAVLRRPGADGRSFLAMAILMAITLAVVIIVLTHVPIQSYYPNRVLWFACLCGLPLVWSQAPRAMDWWMSRRWSRAMKVAVALSASALTLVPVFGLVVAAAGLWTGVNHHRILHAVSQPGASHAQVVWKIGKTQVDDGFTRRLLNYYHAGAKVPFNTTLLMSRSAACEELRQWHEPTVLSAQTTSIVTKSFSCVPGVRVVEVGH